MSFLKHHPKELLVLSLCGIALRFAFWGVGNLLVIYLIQSYHYSIVQSTHVYGVFVGLSAFLPLLGGIIGDKWNYDGPILLGTIFSAVGCFLIIFNNEILLYIALCLLVIGYGIFVPSIFAILNYTYKDKPKYREAGFSLYYASFNIGVLLSMIIVGYIAHTIGWNWGFLLASIVQLLGLIPVIYYIRKYHVTYKDLHPKDIKKKKKEPPLTKIEKNRMFIVILLCVLSIFFWTSYIQGWSSMSVFTLNFTNKNFFGFSIPPAWILSLETLFLILISPLLAKLYQHLQKINRNPSPINKAALAFISIAICFLIMILAASKVPGGAHYAMLSPLYLTIAFFFMAVAEMLIAPISLSSITHLTPKKYTALMVGLYYVCCGIGSYLAGYLAGFIEKMPNMMDFFSIFVIISIIPAGALLIFSKPLNKMRHLKKS
jgi:proton-dependent oligopeptide transporter, POT family